MEGESLDSSGRQGASEQPAPAQPSGKEFVFPLSYAQQRLWLLDRLLPTGSVYNVPRVYRLMGGLNVGSLRAALDELVERHESLRTRFVLEDSGPVQVIAAQLRIGPEVEDLTGLGAAERAGEARRRAQEEAQTPFDLERAPLLRVRLLRLDEQEHWLLLTLHHIITDGWSAGVLSRELSALYAAHCRGEASGLPALPVQYADYAVWQREWLQGEVLEQQLAYWRSALAGLPTLELPTDRPRPAIATFRGGRINFEIDEALTRRIKDVGRAERATLFMTLLAAFQVLLYRYSGQEDIVVGAPIAGRVRPELGGLIGFFVNTLVLRGDLSGEPTFGECLGRVRARALEAYAHQDLPFEKLVEELRPKRDLSRNPLFQVALAMQNTPQGELRLEGIDVAPLTDLSNESAKFDLQFSITEVGGQLRTRVEYAADLFDASTIERLVGHWRELLAGIAANPQQRISRLPLLAPHEREELLAERDATAVDYPRERCVHALFEEQVARAPRAVAVVMGEAQLTYGELNARANQLAHHLRTLGVGPEVLVGLCLERSLDLVVGMLGILKAGGAYVPLDPGYPAARLGFMLADTQAPVLLTRESLLGALPPREGHTLCIDRDWQRIAQQPETNPEERATADNLAYVIYTSGSTGQPKGVMIEHASLVNQLESIRHRFSVLANDCVLQTSPIGLDLSIWQILMPLISGATIALLEPEGHRLADKFFEAIRRHRVTILPILPSMLAVLLSGDNLDRCSTLRLVISTNDIPERRIPAELRTKCKAEFVSTWGAPEATACSTLLTHREDGDVPAPIGVPIDNVRVYVVDQNDDPAPFGVPGELCVGGCGVGRGYWRRPELTAGSFVADPFSPHASARMYRTGDFGVRRLNGNLGFIGRRDRQIKVDGLRIEPAEVEAVLARHPGVGAVSVIAREDSPGALRLVGYFTANQLISPTASGLRDFLKRYLPDYMVPVALVRVPELRFTRDGKVDRQLLPAPGSRDG